jgi:hypothetical protein
MAQTEIAELLIRVRNLEEQVQTLTLQRDAALNMAQRAVLTACDVLSANSNVSGWQVQNKVHDKKTQQLNDLHAIMNDIESLRRSFTLQDSWKNHQSAGHSNGANSHKMPDPFRSSDGTATDLYTRNELGSQRADPVDPDGLIGGEDREIEKKLLQEPIASGLRNSLIKFYMTVGLSTA